MLQLKTSPIHISALREGEGAEEMGGISFFFSFPSERESYNSFLPFFLASGEMPEVERAWLSERGKHETN